MAARQLESQSVLGLYARALSRAEPMSIEAEETVGERLVALRKERWHWALQAVLPDELQRRIIVATDADGQLEPDALLDLDESGELIGEALAHCAATVSSLRPRLAEIAREIASIRQRFVTSNLRLVVKMATRYARRGLALEDLVQEGNIGLLKAFSRFDPRRGFRFSTYAAWWVRHHLGRALVNKSKNVRVPVHMSATAQRVERARRRIELTTGTSPSDEALARACEISLEKVEMANRVLGNRVVSLEHTLPGTDQLTARELLPDDDAPDPDRVLDVIHFGARARKEIDTLSPVEADVLRKRFGLGGQEPLTLREVGCEHHLSRERIRQIQNKALERLETRLLAPATRH